MANITRETARFRFPKHYVGSILEPQDQMTFVDSPIFERRWKQAGLNSQNLRGISFGIMANPTAPAIMEGSYGIRQIRFSTTERVKSKTTHVLLYWYSQEYSIVLLMSVYKSPRLVELSPIDMIPMNRIIERIQTLLISGRTLT